MSKPTLEINQPPIFPVVGLKRLEREADHLHIEPKLRMRKLYLLFSMRLCGVVFD
jgi:hypothetical protein